VERADLPAGVQYWKCPDCDGTFYPKGQLALITHWRHSTDSEHIAGLVTNRTRTTLGVLLFVVGAISTVMASQKASLSLSAASDQVLPSTGPNILTLVLLGVTYLAGTVLAVLGRRVSIVLVGWA